MILPWFLIVVIPSASEDPPLVVMLIDKAAEPNPFVFSIEV